MVVMLWILSGLALANGLHHGTRNKRQLIFTPRNSIVQIILGTGVPVPLEAQQAMTIGWVVKAAYGVPNNSTYFTNPYVTVQKRSLLAELPSVSRYDIYRSIENAFQTFGGKDCVLRAICETSQVPFKGSSIVSQIFHIIFTPSSTNEVSTKPMDRIYEGVWQSGSYSDVSCKDMFPSCTLSLMDLFSVIS